MEIFLVRHGETSGNVASRHQAEHTSLTQKGEEQARLVAEKIKALNPTHLLTSNLVRAIETARVIGEACEMIPETNSHFIELMRPNNVYGHHHHSFKSLFYYTQWYFGRDTSAIDGGESYASLRKRIEKAKNHLATYPDDARVVVVSHTVFINMFIAHLCNNKPLLPHKAFLIFTGILKMPNTHVIPVRFMNGVETKSCSWSVEQLT